jgi:hypothetical protein
MAPQRNSGELEVREDVEDGGGAPAGKMPGKRVRGVFLVLGVERVQRDRRKRQWSGGNLQPDLARVSGEYFLRLARREREGREEWGGASAVDVWGWVAKRVAPWWLIHEEIILSPTRGQRQGGVV